MKTSLIVFVMLVVYMPCSSFADIYMFVDSKGVVHFTNVPTSTAYELYMREGGEKKDGFSTQTSFDGEIETAAGKIGVDPSLVKAVIAVESGFDPKAVSIKGAKGLMQIMPDNYNDLGISDPFDPLQNIMGGTRYLKRLLTRYDDKLPLVLAAYNAGPHAVDRYERVPPFPETKRFIKKVMQRYTVYTGKF